MRWCLLSSLNYSLLHPSNWNFRWSVTSSISQNKFSSTCSPAQQPHTPPFRPFGTQKHFVSRHQFHISVCFCFHLSLGTLQQVNRKQSPHFHSNWVFKPPKNEKCPYLEKQWITAKTQSAHRLNEVASA